MSQLYFVRTVSMPRLLILASSAGLLVSFRMFGKSELYYQDQPSCQFLTFRHTENTNSRNCCIEEYGFDESETTPGKLVSLYEKILLNVDRVHDIERHKAEHAGEKVNKDFSGLIAYLR